MGALRELFVAGAKIDGTYIDYVSAPQNIETPTVEGRLARWPRDQQQARAEAVPLQCDQDRTQGDWRPPDQSRAL